VPLHGVSHLQLGGDFPPVAVFQVLRASALEAHEIRAGVLVHAVPDALPDFLDVVPGHNLGVRHELRDVQRHAHLVDAQVRVGRDDGSAGKVDAFSGKVPAETPLLPLEPLHEAAQGLSRALVLQRQAGKLTVDVHGALDLQKVPVLHQVRDGQALLQALPQHVVHLDDLNQLHRHVVLVGPGDAVHLYAGADAHRRHG
jgi:hypothetical protein